MVFCSLAIWRLGLSYTGIASGSPANRPERPSIYTPSQVVCDKLICTQCCPGDQPGLR